MASIHPHGTGFRVHYRQDGAQRKSPALGSRELAEAWIRQHLPSTLHRSVTDLASQWQGELASEHRKAAAALVSALARARGWGDACRLTVGDLRLWARETPHRGHTDQYLLTILRWAAREHHVPIRGEVLAFRFPRRPRKAKPALLTEDQVQAIRACADSYGPRASAVVDYLLTYGARPITACRLRVADLDLLRGELTISDAKHSGGWRHRLMERHLTTWPAHLLEGDDGNRPLFPHYREDRPWRLKGGSAKEIADWYKNTIGKKLKLAPLGTIYHLKRYAITYMFRQGIDPATIALFTGHLDLAQVMQYAVSNAERQDSALARLG